MREPGLAPCQALPLGDFPQQLAVQVQGQEHFRVVEVAGGEDHPLGDRHARIALAALGVLPDQRRPLPRAISSRGPFSGEMFVRPGP